MANGSVSWPSFAPAVSAVFGELLTGDWKKIGVEIIIKSIDSTAMGKLVSDANFEMILWNLGRTTLFGRAHQTTGRSALKTWCASSGARHG